MTTLQKEILSYRLFCIIYHKKENDGKSLKEYMILKSKLKKGF